jgi:hypothetical protein
MEVASTEELGSDVQFAILFTLADRETPVML